MKKILFTLFLISIFACPGFTEESLSSAAMPLETQSLPYKQPINQWELALKFLYAMGGVVASSVVLFVGLTVYNKIRSCVIKVAETDYANTLSSPNNQKDSINVYLERSKG